MSRNAAENLAYDEAVLRAFDETAAAEGTLRFWESPTPCVVLGRSGKLHEEVNVEACRRNGVPILRRASGGGAVLLGPGCLNFALLLPLDEFRDVRLSYLTILRPAAAALGVDVAGISDLAVCGRKISGNAQRRGRRALLHHGTILYDFDAALMDRYLRQPSRSPAYRNGRPHAAFVANLRMGAEEIKSRLAAAWDAA